MESVALREAVASLYDDTPDAVMLYDAGMAAIAANEAALTALGVPHEALAGRPVTEHLAVEDVDRIELAFETALAGGSDHFDASVKRADGTTVAVECYVFPAHVDGKRVGVFVQAHDIAALKAAEESLAINQQRFRSLFEYHPDGIMELKATGAISRVNVALENETGYYTEQLVGKPWSDLVAPELRAHAEEALRAAMRGEAAEHDSQILDRLGNRIDVQLKLVPLHVRERIGGAYAIFKNVSAQKEAERAIATQSERIRRLYMVAASRGGSIDRQIEATLALGLELFDYDAGFVSVFQGDRLFIRNTAGSSALRPGTSLPIGTTISRLLLGERSMLEINDVTKSEFVNDAARTLDEWQAMVGVRLSAGARVFGTLTFSAKQPRGPLERRDQDLVQLMGLFVAAALERSEHSQHIEQLAFTDALTGLPNRVLFEDRITNALATARRYERGFAVMYLDLDRFKHVNDTFGHGVGDEVLKGVARRLRSTLRESDTIARFGGDEFVILEPVVDGPADAADLARKIHTALQEPIEYQGEKHDVRASIGIALYPGDGKTIEELMENADRALYRAKRAGRNRWLFSDQEAAKAALKKPR